MSLAADKKLLKLEKDVSCRFQVICRIKERYDTSS